MEDAKLAACSPQRLSIPRLAGVRKSRWLLLKREENLKIEQRFRLGDLLRYNLRNVRAYLLKEAFQQLWNYNSATWARRIRENPTGTAPSVATRINPRFLLTNKKTGQAMSRRPHRQRSLFTARNRYAGLRSQYLPRRSGCPG